MGRKPKQDTQDQLDIIGAVKSGDRLETLIALRDMLAQRLQETTSARDISSMVRRLMQCVEEIEILEKQKQDKEARGGFTLNDFRKSIRRTDTGFTRIDKGNL